MRTKSIWNHFSVMTIVSDSKSTGYTKGGIRGASHREIRLIGKAHKSSTSSTADVRDVRSIITTGISDFVILQPLILVMRPEVDYAMFGSGIKEAFLRSISTGM